MRRYAPRVIKDVELREAGAKGLGAFSLRAFKPGDFIFRRRHGRIVRNEHTGELSEDDQRHLCELDFERSAVLLPPGSYLNHSCEPNAMRRGVNVFAWRFISAGEEITIDYRLNAFDGGEWPCECGAGSCTGRVVSDFFSLAAEVQARYLPFAPAFIRREYFRRRARRNSQTVAPESPVTALVSRPATDAAPIK